MFSTRDARAQYVSDLRFNFNGTGVGTNISVRLLEGSGAGVGSGTPTNGLLGFGNGNNTTASTFGNSAVYISNYRSNVAKSISGDSVTENNATNAAQGLIAGLWNNTAAITSIQIIPFTANFAQHSTASIYGITAGSDGNVSVA